MSIKREARFVPAVNSYYFMPPAWIGRKPSNEEYRNNPISELEKIVHEEDIEAGIKIKVSRNGMFTFDCTNWQKGGIIEISENINSQEEAKIRARIEAGVMARTQLMNTHLACLYNFNSSIKPRQLILPSNMILYSWNVNSYEPLNKGESLTSIYILGKISDFRSRKQAYLEESIEIELESVKNSFKLLKEILESNTKNLFNLIDMFYKAIVTCSESRFSEALILCWTVCENLLNQKWENYIEERRTVNNGISRINRERKEKLMGADFTASIVSEILELVDVLPKDIFDALNKIRGKRNKWMHEQKEVTYMDALAAIEGTKRLIQHVTGLQLNIHRELFPGYIAQPKSDRRSHPINFQ